MRLPSIAPYALCISSAAALLAGCSSDPGTGIPTTSGSAVRTHSTSGGKTFQYTGKPQVFRVPPNVQSITVVMVGAAGTYCHSYPGKAGRVFAMIPVTPHEKLWVYVGGQGSGTMGGFNGGGNGGSPTSDGHQGAGGGGASDVRVAPGLSDRVLVAGGGGGDGEPFGNTKQSDFGCAGYGGGLVGGDGLRGLNYYGAGGGGGTGGSQSAGGTGGQGGAPSSPYPGNPGENGALGIGGAGGQVAGGNSDGGGGGGGGYYGGGGGGSGEGGYSTDFGGGGGGGGGSSFAEPKATQVRFWKNWKNATGDGLVVFSWQ